MTQRDPFDEIDDLLDRMGREFEELGDTFGSPDPMGSPDLLGARDPPVDVLEDDAALTVHVDLPGFDDDDMDIELREDALTITATREETSEASIGADSTAADAGNAIEDDGAEGAVTETGEADVTGTHPDDEAVVQYHRQERHSRSVSRTIPLPEPVKRDAATASYDDGVLTVTLPKRSPSDAGGHQIDVN